MKSTVAWILTLWIVLMVEQSRPDLFPSCSLVTPLSVGCLFWFRTATGSILAGLTLIVHWLLHPTFFPVEAMTVLLLSTALIAGGRRRTKWMPGTTQNTHGWWTRPAIAMLTGLICHTAVLGMAAGMDFRNAAAELPVRLMVAVPCLAVVIFAGRVADEFGFRRRSVA